MPQLRIQSNNLHITNNTHTRTVPLEAVQQVHCLENLVLVTHPGGELVVASGLKPLEATWLKLLIEHHTQRVRLTTIREGYDPDARAEVPPELLRLQKDVCA